MLRWRARLPAATLIHLPGGVFQHLISHVRVSASSPWQTQTERGQLWGGFKAPQQLQPLHGSASVGGSQLKLVTLQVYMSWWRCLC